MTLSDTLTVQLIVEDELTIQFISDDVFDVQLTGDLSYIEPEHYTGEYVVIPTREEQYLYTNNLLMTDDVTVREIPYAEVSNEYGITCTIAS